MAYYYETLLPFSTVYKWLAHTSNPNKPLPSFTMREFAFEYRSGAYQRYNSFKNLSDFKASVIKANPTRFEIGAIYSINPNKRKSVPKSAMKPLEKELVFDIDLTDYDDIRTCCSGTKICQKCWKFITIATKIMDTALRDDFGFKSITWVFSGRRGAHCWVSDKKARFLSGSKRRAIIEYLDVLKIKSSGKRLILYRPLHPHVERSLKILTEQFEDVILNDQDPWRDNDKANNALNKLIPDKALNDALRNLWNSKPQRSSFEKWNDINEVYKKGVTKKLRPNALIEAKQAIILQTLYPRLDVEVSRQVIHLLKSPFCIHPGTGNICVPFDPKFGFDPTNSPNLKRLQDEMEKYHGSNVAELISAGGEEWDKTSLKPYVEMFDKMVDGLIATEKAEDASLKRKREE
ncbi:DNA primase subunit PRI1 [Ascoidea rubescens DSM 1968]|uniref:DNA primase n=1 Tax=Ascoidea rubescens DSM 1968 TaxID=1344418 RepID=A0A1D2VS09_9ASCO|nr:DNA primase [Ascoidea rubescens DSM 1968]ODV64393.1 DNA primase [Ascoidea rubescens DSM 1968]